MRAKASTMAPSRAMEPPLNPVPAPRGTMGNPLAVASRMISETCAVLSGKTTARGKPV